MSVSIAKDTRERPKLKSSSIKQVRLPKVRTKTGCFTCRKRKKKCDENGPVCSGCSRNFLCCVWPTNPSETMPKNFQILPSSQDQFNTSLKFNSNVEKIISNNDNTNTKKKEIKSKIQISDEPIETVNDFHQYVSDVPTSLCSVIELKNYNHIRPLPLKTIIPDDIDTVIKFDHSNYNYNYSSTLKHKQTKISSNLQHTSHVSDSFAEFNSISQLFNSIYPNLDDKLLSNFTPELSDNSFYDALMNYTPKVSIPTVNVKSPILAAFREIYFARGCSLLAKNTHTDKYNNASLKHYNNAIQIITENTDMNQSKDQFNQSINNSINNQSEPWSIFAMKQLCAADQMMGLVSESCVSNLIMTSSQSTNSIDTVSENSQNYDKALFYEFLFTYPLSIYFANFDNLVSSMPPSKVFQIYNKEMLNSIIDTNINNNNTNSKTNSIINNLQNSTVSGLNGYYTNTNSSPSDDDSQSDMEWLDNVINTAIINILQNLAKSIWILRTRNSIGSQMLNDNLKQLKNDISIIWTTIQTSEIQSHENSLLLEFAKCAHMSLEILYLTISDISVSASSPIVGFYLDQFITSYQLYSSIIINPNNKHHIPKCFTILPLFIAACAAQTLQQKEFISKELFLISRELGIEFIESLAFAVEDAWCVEQNGGLKTFTRLVSREGFANLVK
ncbi:hypothetical protein DAPK24_043400 [Pichia kluyveri]|uniref:Zn(2)-C6 fungal-type domain-containing protein n=1 Tax=Pichia kluyveri TaxID=36015 RepID=A0AAV5R9I0_PICKL|nr:hypothetical protein DAPK24_043400 [Pichia kluyveri]